MTPSKTIKHLSFLCFALVFASCAKDDGFQDRFDSKMVLEASLEVGAPISDFYAHQLLGNASSSAIEGLEIEVVSNEGSIFLTESAENKGYYNGPEKALILPETTYSLSTSYKGHTISSEAVTPPSMEILESSKDFLDADIHADLLFLEWSGVNTGSFNEYFYVIELIPEEDSPEEIIRTSGEEFKSRVLSYTSEVTLSIDDFNYYGNHLIRVHAINKVFKSMFQPQSSANQDGPSNIMGGYGYFISSSVVETHLEIR